eukprot:c39292_g1_i1 orf=265-717(+)
MSLILLYIIRANSSEMSSSDDHPSVVGLVTVICTLVDLKLVNLNTPTLLQKDACMSHLVARAMELEYGYKYARNRIVIRMEESSLVCNSLWMITWLREKVSYVIAFPRYNKEPYPGRLKDCARSLQLHDDSEIRIIISLLNILVDEKLVS